MLTVPQEFHDLFSAAPERRTDLIVRLDPSKLADGHQRPRHRAQPLPYAHPVGQIPAAPSLCHGQSTTAHPSTAGPSSTAGPGRSTAISPTPCPIRTACLLKDTVKLSCTRNGGAISVLTICFDPAARRVRRRL